MKKKQLILFFLFTFLGFLTLQIPFTKILGANAKFTLFDFIAPTAGAFFGTPIGIFSVFLIQILNLLIHGINNVGLTSIIRLFPSLFAVFYFAKKRTFNILIPALAILGFNLHPIGRSAWQYSMFWFIPIGAHFFRKNLFFRSLGTTFTAHAVGSTLWVWVFGLSKQMWLTLIPQVIIERTLMAFGLSFSYIFLTNLLYYLSQKKFLSFSVTLEKKYILP